MPRESPPSGQQFEITHGEQRAVIVEVGGGVRRYLQIDWVDETYPCLELYTGDTLAPARRRQGLGAEPMTCPPNALQSGQDVIRPEPGESIATTWGAGLA